MTQRTALLIAYHFPPIHGSSGVQRTLRFAQHLPSFGWRPVVLTITPRSYEQTRESKGNEHADHLIVHRSFGFDTARQLSVKGRYPVALATPDRWMTWRWWAVRDALRLIEQYDIDVVWSTFPIATAHKIGLDVARKSGLPWIAEFRDPMWQGFEYPSDPGLNAAWKALEAQIFGRADRVVVTTPGAVTAYARRFSAFDSARIVQIENGYDEETFQRAIGSATITDRSPRHADGRITLLHSGVLYPSERDPSQFFAAIASLKKKGALSAQTIRVVLRASGHDDLYRPRLTALGINDIVHLEPAIDYLDAIREMMSVDGLLLLQASNCNAQVPAKLYEYLRASRPIAALTDPDGDTATTIRAMGVGLIGRLDCVTDIERTLLCFSEQIRNGQWRRAAPEIVARYSRKAQAGRLARLMSELSEVMVTADA